MGLINPPGFLPDNVHYEVVMGSVSYGVSDDMSDSDVYGFCMPHKDDVFPHLRGEIPGFGRQKQRFQQYEQHHIKDASTGRKYDLTIYSIVKYFDLCMENNPNMVDSLFVPRRCVLHTTRVGEMVRERRKMFLHKGSFHKFRGYAFSMLSKIDSGANRSNPKRAELIEKFGYDTKFGYHLVRLALECEQILEHGDLDLGRDRETMKSIRRGEWSLDQLKEWFAIKEKSLEKLYETSKLPHGPDEGAIKGLLVQCLEEHYGSLQAAIAQPEKHGQLIAELEELVRRYR
jgi:predicted nucleotidyltransferase